MSRGARTAVRAAATPLSGDFNVSGGMYCDVAR